MRNLSDKVAVITGASRGIGAGIARAFAAEKSKLVLCARDKSALAEFAGTLDLDRSDILCVSADVSKAAGMRKIVKSALKKFDRIDIFINNAGVGFNRTILELSESDFDRVFATNLKSVFLCFKELLPYYHEQDYGQIINISSMAGKQGVPGLSVYCASKAGVNTLSEAVAGEVRSDNIKISVLAPGSTDTGFMSRQAGKAAAPSAHKRAKLKLQVEEVADAVIFMAKQNENAWMSMADIRPLVVKK